MRRDSGKATRRIVRLVVLASCVGAIDGCARVAPGGGSWAVAQQPTAAASVVVRNHHGADLRVYVMAADGASHRLGIAPRLGAATLVLPRHIRLPAQLTFVAIPLSSDEPQVIGPIDVDVGTNLVFTVESAAPSSTLVKRP
jgi:hypothetical protein